MSPPINPRAHGATATGTTLDTAALQAALNQAAATQGTVHLPPGTYLTGSLFIPSHTRLHLAPGATLLGSTDIAEYPLIDTRVAGIEMRWPAALINFIGVEHAALTGEGCIDGNGPSFWAAYWEMRKAYAPRGLRWAADYDCQRPRLVLLQRVRDVAVAGQGDGLLLRRSGFWTVQVCYSQQVKLDRLRIRNNEGGHGPSTDGVDIDSSERVLVRRVDIAVNDDGLCVKAGRDADGQRVGRGTRRVLFADCIVREGSTGIAFGSETSGGFDDVRVRRLRVLPAVPVGVLVKSARTRGGWARGLRLTDLQLDGVAVPLRISLDWNPAYSLATLPAAEAPNAPPHWHVLTTPVPPERGLMQLHDLRIERLSARGATTAFEVDAAAAAPIGSLQVVDSHIEARTGGHLLDVSQVQFERCQLQWAQPLVVHRAAALQGLAPALWREDPSHPRRDVSALDPKLQDVN